MSWSRGAKEYETNISNECETFISVVDVFNSHSFCQHQLLFYMLVSIDLHNRPLIKLLLYNILLLEKN